MMTPLMLKGEKVGGNLLIAEFTSYYLKNVGYDELICCFYLFGL